jgi:hypothetical protein
MKPIPSLKEPWSEGGYAATPTPEPQGEIRRYRFIGTHGEGDWVKYADHESALRAAREAREQAEAALREVEYWAGRDWVKCKEIASRALAMPSGSQ